MKNIKQIFKNNTYLMDELEVIELIDYCRELESSVIDNSQKLDQTVVLKQLISEINNSCSDVLKENEKNKRWPLEFEKIDFETTIINLKKYINDYCKDNKIYL